MTYSLEKIKKTIPKKNVLKEITGSIRKAEIWQHSTFITYYILLTAFPLIVGIINAIQQFEGELTGVYWFIQRITPPPLAEQLMLDIQMIYDRSNVGIFIFAVISTVWTVSWTMAALLMGLNKAYGVKHRRNIVVLRIVAFFLTFVFAGVIWMSATIIQRVTSTSLGRWGLFIPIAIVLFSQLYYLVPNVKQRFQSVLPGALFSTGALIIGITLYRLFVFQLPEDSTFFTLAGSFMVVLALIQKLSLAILAGGTINAILIRKKQGAVIEKNDESKFIRLLEKIGMMQFKDE